MSQKREELHSGYERNLQNPLQPNLKLSLTSSALTADFADSTFSWALRERTDGQVELCSCKICLDRASKISPERLAQFLLEAARLSVLLVRF